MIAKIEMQVDWVMCSVEVDMESAEVGEIIDTLVAPCLLGLGYHWDSVEGVLNPLAPVREQGAEDDKMPIKTCSWAGDRDGSWESSCGLKWEFNDEGGPLENEMHYCPKCRKALSVQTYSESEFWDEE